MNKITLRPYELCDTSGKVRRINEVPVIQFDEESYLVPTWKNYQEICYNLADNLLEAGIQPVEMITLANGGFVCAKFVQDRMKYKGKVLTIGIEGYGQDNKPLLEPILKNGLSPDLAINGDVLIVDDIFDKGTAKKVAHAEVLKKNPTKIHFGFAFMRIQPQIPEEFAGVVIGQEWVLFPSDSTENEENLRAMWTKTGINGEIQDLRVELICAQNIEEQQSLINKLNDL